MSKKYRVENAPRDGTRIYLHRLDTENFTASRVIGRWACKEDALYKLGPQWLSDENKYIDMLVNPFTQWRPL